MPEEQPGARAGSDLQRRYPVALLLYGVLAVLVWFTIGEGTIIVFGRPVEMRWGPDSHSRHLRFSYRDGPAGG